MKRRKPPEPRESPPYISPGRPAHIDDLVQSSAQVQRRTPGQHLRDAVDAVRSGSEGQQRAAALRGLPPERSSASRRRAISPCTSAQRARAKAMGCVVTGATEAVDPLHLIPRGMTTVGQDEPLAVVGCRRDIHRLYDSGDFDLLPFLTGRHDDAVAFAVARVGLVTALERITNTKWKPELSPAYAAQFERY